MVHVLLRDGTGSKWPPVHKDKPFKERRFLSLKLAVLLCKLGKKFVQNFISSRDGPIKKYRNKAEMKERKKTVPYICKNTQQM